MVAQSPRGERDSIIKVVKKIKKTINHNNNDNNYVKTTLIQKDPQKGNIHRNY